LLIFRKFEDDQEYQSVLIFLLHTDCIRIYPLPDFSGLLLGPQHTSWRAQFSVCPYLQVSVFYFRFRPSFPSQILVQFFLTILAILACHWHGRGGGEISV